MSLNEFAKECHENNSVWWHDPCSGARIQRNVGELIALMHSELSEMLEGVRKDLMDTHLPNRKAEEVEAADLLIRLGDYAYARGLDLDGAVKEKMEYNRNRADHKPNARLSQHGKKF